METFHFAQLLFCISFVSGQTVLNSENGQMEKEVNPVSFLGPLDDVGVSGRFYCLDNSVDFESGVWKHTFVSSNVHGYAETVQDLPLVLKAQFEAGGQINASGLFYCEGVCHVYLFQLPRETSLKPLFLYVRYTGGFINSSSSESAEFCASPGLPSNNNPGGVFVMDPPQSFEWKEEIVEIDETDGAFYQVFTRNAGKGDFFIVDKVAVTQNIELRSSGQVKDLCRWNNQEEEEGTTTTTKTKTTTESTPGEICADVGYFPDPADCSKFHQCELNEDGSFMDNVFNCPPLTVWCQDILACQNPSICPCS